MLNGFPGLVIGALAVWRIGSMLAGERGLFGICTAIRSLVGVDHDALGLPRRTEGEVNLNPVTQVDGIDTFLHEVALGLTCIWCNSVWIGAIAALFWARSIPEWMILAFALSGGALVINRFI